MLLNVCSANNKTCTLHELITDNSLEALFLTETWMTNHDTATIAAILPETHDFFHFPREDRKGGGVGAAISKNLGSVKSVNLTFNSFECIEVNVSYKNKKLSFYVIYRPPQGSPILTFFEEFSSFLTESQMANEMSVYVGDFNIWMNDKNYLRANEMYIVQYLRFTFTEKLR